MQERLIEIRQLKTSLIRKNLAGVINDQILKEQLEELEQETTNIQAELIGVAKTEINKEELIDFTKQFLLQPSVVWQNSDLETQKKLQWFAFPQGIVFEDEKFRTTKVACLFKAKEAFPPLMSVVVDPTGLEPATSSLQMRRSSQMS